LNAHLSPPRRAGTLPIRTTSVDRAEGTSPRRCSPVASAPSPHRFPLPVQAGPTAAPRTTGAAPSPFAAGSADAAKLQLRRQQCAAVVPGGCTRTTPTWTRPYQAASRPPVWRPAGVHTDKVPATGRQHAAPQHRTALWIIIIGVYRLSQSYGSQRKTLATCRREIPIPNNRSDTRRNAARDRVMAIDLHGMGRGDLEPKTSSYVRRPPSHVRREIVTRDGSDKD
jgi:hypothetical protein